VELGAQGGARLTGWLERFWRLLLSLPASFPQKTAGALASDLLLKTALGLYSALSRPTREVPGREVRLLKAESPYGTLVYPEDSGPTSILEKPIYTRVRDIRPDDVVIDIGAHVGAFTLKAARKAVNGLVIAVEPHPANFKLLVRNIRFNRLENVVPIQAAICDKTGRIRLYSHGDSVSHSVVLPGRRGCYVEVRAITLDELVGELGLKRVDFVKIDAEGAELHILRGGRATLRKMAPFLSIAAYHTPSEAIMVMRFLHKLGYRFATYRGPEDPYLKIFAFRPRKRLLGIGGGLSEPDSPP